MSQNLASFAPYTLPPDEQPAFVKATPWFSSQEQSYQSGAIPTLQTSFSGDVVAAEEADGPRNQWATRTGFRVDVEAAIAYLFGPLSALAVLILETENDYVRFHAYQSALLITPLLALRFLFSLLQLPSWIRTVLSLVIISTQVFMAYRAYIDAAQNGLARFHIPYVGEVSEQWVAEE